MGAPKIREAYVIGDQPTGRIDGIFITATAHQGLMVMVNGKPARLAIIDDQNNVLAAGADVAHEAEAVAVNSYRNFLKAEGHLVVMSVPLIEDSAK
jgi:hypothetical protein